jgi:peptidoglycan/LPS O-acetylase OafA/YrhL
LSAGVREEIGTIGPIEGLRGIAVLWVIAFHFFVLRVGKFDDPWLALIDSTRALKTIVTSGHLGVDLFFLITGFLLTLPWVRHKELALPWPSAREFYRRRLRRIVPAYYVHLALLFALFMPLVLGGGYLMRNLWTTLYNAGAHATFLHYMTPLSSASMNLNGALWTLALEMQYYLVLPLLAPLFARAPWRTAAALVAVAAWWRWLSWHDLDWLVRLETALVIADGIPESAIRHLVQTQLPGYLAHFAAGMLAGRAWLLLRERPATPARRAAWVAFAAAVPVFLYFLDTEIGAFLGELTWLLFPALLATAIFALVSRAPALAQPLLGNAPLAFAGRVSYSAYLYHVPLLLLLNKYGPRDATWLTFPAFVAAVLAIAWISYRLVEQPFLRSRPPKGDPWPKSAAPGASEAPSTSPTTTASGGAPSTTIASTSSS